MVEREISDVPRARVRVILAGGGLLWQGGSVGSPLALVHRPRYDDWSLPKGKLKEGEPWQHGACREVQEETGCEVRVTSLAGICCYRVSSGHKLVLFWNMAVGREAPFVPSAEVDRVEWLLPHQAVERLDHRADRQLVRDNPAGFVERSSHGWMPTSPVRDRRYRRVSGLIQAYRIEMAHRIERYHQQDGTDLTWAPAAVALLDQAAAALGAGELDHGWRRLNAARRMELFGLERAKLEFRAEAIQQETTGSPPGDWSR